MVIAVDDGVSGGSNKFHVVDSNVHENDHDEK